MDFFRQQIVPIVTIIIALLGLVVVTARSFIGADLAQPAPLETIYVQPITSSIFSNYTSPKI